jgi:hypothetical protein
VSERGTREVWRFDTGCLGVRLAVGQLREQQFCRSFCLVSGGHVRCSRVTTERRSDPNALAVRNCGPADTTYRLYKILFEPLT